MAVAAVQRMVIELMARLLIWQTREAQRQANEADPAVISTPTATRPGYHISPSVTSDAPTLPSTPTSTLDESDLSHSSRLV